MNGRITLLKSMLLINHKHIKSIPGWLVRLTKVSQYVNNSTESHKLWRKLLEDTGGENSRSTSIIIHPLSVSSQIQLVGPKSGTILLDLLFISVNNDIILTLVCILFNLSSIGSKGLASAWAWKPNKTEPTHEVGLPIYGGWRIQVEAIIKTPMAAKWQRTKQNLSVVFIFKKAKQRTQGKR
jgi:hypothetical protein